MDTNILNGPEENSGIPHESFGKLLLDALNLHVKNNLAMVDIRSGESYTYGDFVEFSQNLASNLRELGIEKNVVVGIVSENSHKYCVALLANYCLAAPVHLINPESTEYELKHFLSLSEAKLLFCSNKSLDTVLKVKNEVHFIKTIVLFDDDDDEKERNLFFYKDLIKTCTTSFHVEDDINTRTHTAIICNTSGTTGLPKGVMITHENLRVHLVYSQIFHMEPLDSIQLVLPHFHIYAVSVIHFIFYSGSTLLTLDHFDPKIFLQTIQDYQVKQVYLVPPLINFLVNSPLTQQYNLSSVKYFYNSAAPVLEEDSKLLRMKFNQGTLHHCYGLTETSGLVMCTQINKSTPSGSCGKLAAGCQLKIVDGNSQKSLAANKNGEIYIKGGQLMKGYINNVDETNKMFDSEGFLRTGDIGYYDDEGFVYIVGRIKDMINYKGYKVSPVEIENILLKHPSIKDVAVVGKPDRRSGEVAVGFIVKEEGAKVTEDEICNYVSKFVSTQKRLHGGIHFIDVIPKNKGGKILRNELRQKLEQL